MNGAALIGILSLFPAAALWTAWPRRRWAAWTSAGVCLGYWLLGFSLIERGLAASWVAAGLGCMTACLYALLVVSRNNDEYDRMDAEESRREKRNGELGGSVEGLRGRIRGIEAEQREVLALYSMIKGLSEALSWEDMRPKLDMAVRQYLAVEEFALYVAEARAQDKLKPLVRRKLNASPGGSWETLERTLQERGLPFRVPHALAKPEPAIAVPVFTDGKLMGYFYARVPAELAATELLAKAQTFVDEISFALRRVRLFQEVEQSSQIDGLTGVHRRGVFDRRLEEECVRAQTFKTGFCLMLLDIDHFKSLNDKYGHPFGDQVLRRIGAILRESVYETDFVARYGGEEFAVLLPRADPEGVLRKAERLRKAVESAAFELAMRPVRVTISIGIAHFPRDGESAEAVLREADRALYQAKESGRNRFVDLKLPGRTQ